MSRAQYVWVVTMSRELIAAFTVKHELQSYLGRRTNQTLNMMRIQRVNTSLMPHHIVDLDPFSLEPVDNFRAPR